MAYQSEKAFSGDTTTELVDEDTIKIPKGKTKETVVKTRINQFFFRKTVLASYGACCITGIPTPELLVASR